MTTEGSAVYCPTCTYHKAVQEWDEIMQKLVHTGIKKTMHFMLGSVTPDGLLALKMSHGGRAYFTHGTIALSCNCGYTVEVVLQGSDNQSTNLTYVQN